MYMKYRHEGRAGGMIERLCGEEEGIMRAEKAVTKVSRDYRRFALKMAEMKNSMDRAQALLIAQEKGEKEGLEKGRMENSLEIAQKLKARGRPIDEIAEDTGLSRKAIEKL